MALCHYGHCLTIDNSITIHDTLPWNEFGIFRKKNLISLLLLSPERKYMQIG